MLIVKLFCWEYHVLKQISEVRAKEVSALKKFSYLVALLVFLMYVCDARGHVRSFRRLTIAIIQRFHVDDHLSWNVFRVHTTGEPVSGCPGLPLYITLFIAHRHHHAGTPCHHLPKPSSAQSILVQISPAMCCDVNPVAVRCPAFSRAGLWRDWTNSCGEESSSSAATLPTI